MRDPRHGANTKGSNPDASPSAAEAPYTSAWTQVLFNASVATNLAYGAPEATAEKFQTRYSPIPTQAEFS